MEENQEFGLRGGSTEILGSRNTNAHRRESQNPRPEEMLMFTTTRGDQDGKSRLQQTQEEVEQVKDIMLDNMEKANERSGKLNDLEQQAEDLLEKGLEVGVATGAVRVILN
ncbi:uncharacterized protein LOC102229934 isoform X4 [Xiphophorus maculatus]|uniref:uncharacterized protein LOC102229934 isoform X4 n=1 Tax=Xiphophorus maculatus TaxID=8083 RepID=UPI000C6DFA03|nr:uncharacterized protein LOC102229934 isoform X4 [Xiphophorus maculatus]